MSSPSRVRPATRGDLPEIVDLLNACDVVETGEPDSTLEDLENDWNADGFTPGQDAWVAEAAGGVIVGYAYAGDQYRSGELEADLWTHPGHHEDGLGDRLLGVTERRAAEIAAQRGYAGASLGVFCISANHAKRDLLRRRGYVTTRTVFRMSIDLSDGNAPLSVPQGFDIRPFRLGTDERVMYETMNDAFVDHFRHDEEPFDSWHTRLLGHADFDPDLWWLAWSGTEPAAGLIAYDHGDLGWVKQFGVRRPWRRRGLGDALLSHAFDEFARRGQKRVDLGVDAEGETHPLRLYERAGMQATSSYELYARTL